MRSANLRLGILFSAFLCAAGLFTGAMLRPQTNAATADKKDSTQPAASSVPLEEEPLYILRDYHGKIAVFSSFEAVTPNFVTDFDVASLPQQDRQFLADGIPLKSAEELQQILEDYGS